MNMVLICYQGPGIPQAEREKVFEMFYTVDHGDWGRLRGTGLGLAICRARRPPMAERCRLKMGRNGPHGNLHGS